MNYGNYTKYTITFFIVLEYFRKNTELRKYFGIFGVFNTINRYFEYRIRILCI